MERIVSTYSWYIMTVFMARIVYEERGPGGGGADNIRAQGVRWATLGVSFRREDRYMYIYSVQRRRRGGGGKPVWRGHGVTQGTGCGSAANSQICPDECCSVYLYFI